MSKVKRIGDWEVEIDLTEGMIFISDRDGRLLAEFKDDDHFKLIEWIQNNK